TKRSLAIKKWRPPRVATVRSPLPLPSFAPFQEKSRPTENFCEFTLMCSRVLAPRRLLGKEGRMQAPDPCRQLWRSSLRHELTATLTVLPKCLATQVVLNADPEYRVIETGSAVAGIQARRGEAPSSTDTPSLPSSGGRPPPLVWASLHESENPVS